MRLEFNVCWLLPYVRLCTAAGHERVTLNFLTCTSDNVWKEALSDAAKTGKRDMVRYLLNSEYISENLHTEVMALH